ncbi:IS6 family transposase [Streptomyces sp. JNUCC 63]
MESPAPSYRGHQYPVEVISHCVWLYFRFPLSFREVEESMLQRGVIVSYETIRRWSAKFGQTYANGLRRRRPRPGYTWYLDEVFVTINGEQKYLWRAVDAGGNVLDILLQSRRDEAAARRFFRRPMRKTRAVPGVVVADQLRSCGAAHREVMFSVEHRSHKGLNSRAENSHRPTRRRERAMKGFRSIGAAQRFLAAFSGISPHFRPRRHLMTAPDHRAETTVRFAVWDQITGPADRSTTA